ncbi:MAG: hypothetical protein MHPSP_001964 [Paramarteilia canceri]
MITSDGYNEKADIWSIGIVCFEMTEGIPPYYNMPPLRAMLMIPKGEKPKLDKNQLYDWSKSLIKFIDECLEKDPEKRPSAKALLKSDFLSNYDSRHTDKFKKVIESAIKISSSSIKVSNSENTIKINQLHLDKKKAESTTQNVSENT